MWNIWKFTNIGGHIGFWKPSWIFLKLPYFSHFESDWCQILNLSQVQVNDVTKLTNLKFWQSSWILEDILNFLEIPISQSWRKESYFTFFIFGNFDQAFFCRGGGRIIILLSNLVQYKFKFWLGVMIFLPLGGANKSKIWEEKYLTILIKFVIKLPLMEP